MRLFIGVNADGRPLILGECCMDEKQTMSEAEFCRAVGISRTTAWQLRKQGRLPYYRLGAKILYSQEHVREFLTSIERKAVRPRPGRRQAAA